MAFALQSRWISQSSVSLARRNRQNGQIIIPFRFPLWVNSWCYWCLSHLHDLFWRHLLWNKLRCGLYISVCADITIVNVSSDKEKGKMTRHYFVLLPSEILFLLISMPLTPLLIVWEGFPSVQFKMWPLYLSLHRYNKRQCLQRGGKRKNSPAQDTLHSPFCHFPPMTTVPIFSCLIFSPRLFHSFPSPYNYRTALFNLFYALISSLVSISFVLC